MSVAEAIAVGDFCKGCGVVLGEGPGYPRSCAACGGSEKRRPIEYDMSPNQKELKMLEAAGFHVEVKNHNHHWIITKTVRADYWPSSEKYRIMNKGKTLFGFKAMFEAISKIRI